MIGRRALLGGVAAAIALPATARPGAGDADLRRALDDLAMIPGPEDRLARLARFDPRALSAGARIDLMTVRPALAIDVRLAGMVPGKATQAPVRIQLPAESPGMWQLADGEAAYRLLLGRLLGADCDPEAAHRRFEREAARLTARAGSLFRDLGLTRGSVGERYRALFADPRWHYPASDAGRDRAVADMNRWLDAARARIPETIGAVPPECLDVGVRRMGAADEAAGKGGYRQLPARGRSGAYFVDLREIARRPSWSLESVVHHELLPGHMIQLPIEAAANPHPLRLAYLPAYPEGWAIHAEARMAGAGAYAHAPANALGHLHWLLFRIGRGLADTGIHHRRWDLAEARRRLEALHGEPAYFAPFDADLQRIRAEPGIRAAEALTALTLSDFASNRATTRRALVDGRVPTRLLRG